MLICRVVFLVVALIAGPVFASEFTVDDWRVYTSVMADGVGSEGHLFDGVANPFKESHQVELGPSSASASYDFGWDAENGHFSIESQIAAEITGSGWNRVSTYGWILITPSVDLAFHIDSTMDFDLPAQVMLARMRLSVGAGIETLYYQIRAHDTFGDGLGTGTLSLDDDFILPAGRTWTLYYDLYIHTDTDDWLPGPGSVGEIGTAESSVNFSFTVLPEPSTLGLLAMSGVVALFRRRRA